MASRAAVRFEGELGFALDLDADAFPFSYRTPKCLDDSGLEAFGRRNRPFRVEQSANGELVIMNPVGAEGSRFEAYLSMELFLWARSDRRGISFGPDVGCRIDDGSVLAPDASWIAKPRWEALPREQRRGFLPFCPEFIVEVRCPKDRVAVIERKMESEAEAAEWQNTPFYAKVRGIESTTARGLLPEAVGDREYGTKRNEEHGGRARAGRGAPVRAHRCGAAHSEN